jgi:uncharacterized protein DUF4136
MLQQPARPRIIHLLVLLLALPTTARAAVDVGYDTQVDFTQFKTFAWTEGGSKAPRIVTENRIHAEVEKELAAKGIKKAEGEADLLVVTFADWSTVERVDAPSFAGLPNTWTGWSAATTVRGSSKGSLKVDLIDRRSNQLIWRGVAIEGLGLDPDSEKVGKKVVKVVKKMFESFPPPKKD